MRTAPAIHTIVSANRLWQWAVCGLAMLGVLSVAAWLMTPLPPGWEAWAPGRWCVGAMTFALAVWAVHRELRVPVLGLRWDGQAWWWQGPGMLEPEPCSPRVVADFGTWMLLRCTSSGALPRRWLALQQQVSAKPQWQALRCALYASGAAR